MNALEQVEREIAEFRQQIERSSTMLDTLSSIQMEFEDLARTHQSIKSSVGSGQVSPADLEQLRQRLQDQLSSLEKLIDSIRKEVLGELATAQDNLTTANRNLKTDLSQQMSRLKQDVESKLIFLENELVQPKETIQSYVAEFEARVRTELRAVLNRIEQSGFSPTHLERLDKLDTRLQAAKTSIKAQDNRIDGTRTIAMIAAAMAIAALAVSVVTEFVGNPPLPGGETTEQSRRLN